MFLSELLDPFFHYAVGGCLSYKTDIGEPLIQAVDTDDRTHDRKHST